MPVKGDQTVVRALNRRLILRLLREQGPVSRSELVELTGLSGAAVTRLVQDLIDEDYLVEQSMGVSTGGRPPVLLDLGASRRVVPGSVVGDEAVVQHARRSCRAPHRPRHPHRRVVADPDGTPNLTDLPVTIDPNWATAELAPSPAGN